MIGRLVRLVVFEWQKLLARRLALVALVLVALVAAASPLAGHVVDAAQAMAAGKRAAADEFANGWTTLASGIRAGLTFALFVVLIFAGSSVSEEAHQGTLKALFLRPVKRTELLVAKWIALSCFAVLLLAVMTAAAAAAGGARFGFGDVVDPEYTTKVRETKAAMVGYTATALGLVVPGLLALVAFGLLFSTAIDHPGYAVGTAIAAFLVLGIGANLSKTLEGVLFQRHVGISLELLGDIAEQFSGARTALGRTIPRTLAVSGSSTVVFLAFASFLLNRREVGD